jgi:hypothetical protein
VHTVSAYIGTCTRLSDQHMSLHVQSRSLTVIRPSLHTPKRVFDAQRAPRLHFLGEHLSFQLRRNVGGKSESMNSMSKVMLISILEVRNLLHQSRLAIDKLLMPHQFLDLSHVVLERFPRTVMQVSNDLNISHTVLFPW